MIKKAVCVLLCVFLYASEVSSAGDYENFRSSVRALVESLKKSNMSVAHLKILLDAGDDVFVPMSYLKETGDMRRLLKLQEFGLVRVKKMEYLRGMKGPFISVTLTDRGREIVAILRQ